MILENVESSDDDYDQAINESGSYRIPHNYDPDANKINISIDGSLSNDDDYPDSIDNYLWTLVSSDNGAGGLAAIDDYTGTTTDVVSFTVPDILQLNLAELFSRLDLLTLVIHVFKFKHVILHGCNNGPTTIQGRSSTSHMSILQWF